MSETLLDLEYVRAVGEDVHARLFPRPTRVRDAEGTMIEGPTPFPLPVLVRYQPSGEVVVDVLFVKERSFQWVGDDEGPPLDADPDRVWIVLDGATLVLRLEMGREPDLALYVSNGDFVPDDPKGEAVVALLRAITGVL